jgi:hypothetical protein
MNANRRSLTEAEANRTIRALEREVIQRWGKRIAPTRGLFRRVNESAPEIGTRWWSEVNSYCRYRFVNSQTTHQIKFCDIEMNCKAYRPAAHFERALGSPGATETKWPAVLSDAAATSVAMSFIAHDGNRGRPPTA